MILAFTEKYPLYFPALLIAHLEFRSKAYDPVFMR